MNENFETEEIIMICNNCGNQIPDNSNVCPNCGHPVQNQYGQPQYQQPQYAQPQYGQPQYAQPEYMPPQPQQPAGQPGKGFAIAALVLGIVSFLCFPYITGALGIIFGSVAKNKGFMGGMATAGIICGVIGIALQLILTVAGCSLSMI